MTLPFRRHSRPRGPARLALAGDFPGDGRDITEVIGRPADWDGTTIEFAGASGAGLPGGIAYDAATSHGTSPLARLRAGPRYGPPEPAPAGYAATTGPLPVIGRPAVSIGDALTHDDAFGPKLAPLPCGHCGTPPSVPARILDRTRIIGHVNWLAARDGWKFDTDLIWTCPACQAGDEWKARQGQLELHRFDEPCDRHDAPAWEDVDPDECRCTCPAAVLAVDVMLRSHDYLKTGRALSLQILKDAEAGAR